jgi:hypothetical protein
MTQNIFQNLHLSITIQSWLLFSPFVINIRLLSSRCHDLLSGNGGRTGFRVHTCFALVRCELPVHTLLPTRACGVRYYNNVYAASAEEPCGCTPVTTTNGLLVMSSVYDNMNNSNEHDNSPVCVVLTRYFQSQKKRNEQIEELRQQGSGSRDLTGGNDVVQEG